jgi:UDP-GlcNAc:undecaprenyl-phosphate GlcNAc-1-phosphate transferase
MSSKFTHPVEKDQTSLMREFVFILPISFIVTFAAVPMAQQLARALGAIDVPRGPLQIHDRPIPRLGGLAIFCGFLTAILGVIFFGGSLSTGERFLVLPILLGAMMMLGLGAIDDIRGVQPRHRFYVQVPAAVLLIIFGIVVNIPFLLPLGMILTIFYVIGACNSLNLLDGIDGLAAGTTAIAALAFGTLFLIRHDTLGIILSAAMVGSVLGFLWYNLSPASIFMGDSGSLFLGFMLAVLAIRSLQSADGLLAHLVPVAILGVPIFDTGLTVLRRIINHKPLLPGDRAHSYDKLMAAGLKSRQTVLVMYAMGVVFAATGILLTRIPLAAALALITLELTALMTLARKFNMLQY